MSARWQVEHPRLALAVSWAALVAAALAFALALGSNWLAAVPVAIIGAIGMRVSGWLPKRGSRQAYVRNLRGAFVDLNLLTSDPKQIQAAHKLRTEWKEWARCTPPESQAELHAELARLLLEETNGKDAGIDDPWSRHVEITKLSTELLRGETSEYTRRLEDLKLRSERLNTERFELYARELDRFYERVQAMPAPREVLKDRELLISSLARARDAWREIVADPKSRLEHAEDLRLAEEGTTTAYARIGLLETPPDKMA